MPAPPALRWFDRAFAFDLPAALLPNVLERLRGTPDRLDALVRAAPPAALTRRDGQRWSAQEHLGHLLDLEGLWRGRVDDLRDGVPLRPADLENRKTHEARHNDRPADELLAAFRAARADLVRAVEALGPEAGERRSQHPRLQQPMRLVDLLVFVAEHDDHHLAHARALVS